MLSSIIACLNLFAFSAFALDKLNAKLGRRRMPNKALKLLLVMFPMGGLAGMLFFRHKTRKATFWLTGIAGLIVWSTVLSL